MPRKVALVSAGMSRFGARPETPKRLFDEAWAELHARAPKWDGKVDEAWVGTVGFGGHQPGNSAALFLQGTAGQGAPAHRVENACASSGFAIRDAWLAVRSGEVDVALAAGVESMTPHSRPHRGAWLGVSGDTEVERASGLTFPGVYALMARAHMQRHGTTRQQLAAVAVKNHAFGAHNPHAQFQKPTTLEKALAAPMVADPLGLFDCCSTTDGAAAVLLVAEERVPDFTPRPVWLEGSGAATDTLALHDRKALDEVPAARAAAAKAFAGTGHAVRDLDFAEVHDCFTIAEVLAIEALGIVPKGQGGPATEAGRTGPGGDLPTVNPSGGLKAKGHPLGATGAGQAVEVFEQLHGLAGGRQVKDAALALTHNVGGSGATCAVHVWRKGWDDEGASDGTRIAGFVGRAFPSAFLVGRGRFQAPQEAAASSGRPVEVPSGRCVRLAAPGGCEHDRKEGNKGRAERDRPEQRKPLWAPSQRRGRPAAALRPQAPAALRAALQPSSRHPVGQVAAAAGDGCVGGFGGMTHQARQAMRPAEVHYPQDPGRRRAARVEL